MINDQSGIDAEAMGRPDPTAETGGDRDLLALEAQLGDLIDQLYAAQRESGVPTADPNQRQAVLESAGVGVGSASAAEAQREHVETILARLYPIERAIMVTPAHSITGLGVKARDAAYVMSQYWEQPTDKIDWEAQTIRLLIEAVCDVARKPLLFRIAERQLPE